MGIVDSLEWVDSDTLVYITMEDIHRPFKVWRQHLGSDQSDDTCLYHEKDEEFHLELHQSESKEYHFFVSGNKTTQFVLYLNLFDPRKELKYVTQCIEGVDTVELQAFKDYLVVYERRKCWIELGNEEIVISNMGPSQGNEGQEKPIGKFNMVLSSDTLIGFIMAMLFRDFMIIKLMFCKFSVF